MTFIEWLFGKKKLTTKELRTLSEHKNEENYREHTIALREDMEIFKAPFIDGCECCSPNKAMMLKALGHTDATKLRLKELLKLGFNSEHITLKHLEDDCL